MEEFFKNFCKETLAIADHEDLEINQVSVIKVLFDYNKLYCLIFFTADKVYRSWIACIGKEAIKDKILILPFPDGLEKKIWFEGRQIKVEVL